MINPDKIDAGNAAISKFMERSSVLTYHQSWNLLMPVIVKLTQEKFRAGIYFNSRASSTVIYDPLNHWLEITTEGSRESAIMSAWKSVVKFIEMNEAGNEPNA